MDAVADVHDVLRSQAFRLSMRLHGIPAAHIDKDRAGKRRFIRCGGRGMEPLRHTVLRYCDTFRWLGFVFEDPAPAEHRPLENPFGEKTGPLGGLRPLLRTPGPNLPRSAEPRTGAAPFSGFDRVFIHSGGGAGTGLRRGDGTNLPNVTALSERVRLAGEMALVSNLDCVVAMDSLVMHLAALVGTPVVSVWGATHPGLGFLGYGVPRRESCRPIWSAALLRFSAASPAATATGIA